MTKEYIYESICEWIENGQLVQKSSQIQNGHWYSVWKAVERGELFFTSNDRIVATDRDVRDQFEEWFRAGRVMSQTGVTIRHPDCTSALAVSKLVKQGTLLKIDKFKSVTLYIQ